MALKSFDSVRHSVDRSRLVTALVHQQINEMKGITAREDTLNEITSSAEWPDDFIALERWLIQQWSSTSDSLMIMERLQLMSEQHSLSPTLKKSLSRWKNTLYKVSVFKSIETNLTGKTLFAEGQQRYFEAEGYKKIGRQYDAMVLYLWVGALLTQFLEKSPMDKDTPQALFMLGASLAQLRHAFPRRLKNHLILNLCSEFYPYSVWSKRAAAYWRDETDNGT
jgi:hypothetical protein